MFNKRRQIDPSTLESTALAVGTIGMVVLILSLASSVFLVPGLKAETTATVQAVEANATCEADGGRQAVACDRVTYQYTTPAGLRVEQTHQYPQGTISLKAGDQMPLYYLTFDPEGNDARVFIESRTRVLVEIGIPAGMLMVGLAIVAIRHAGSLRQAA
jgi:hypothetical protein